MTEIAIFTGTAAPFVGRREELDDLAGEVERVRAGTPRIVTIEGPAGMGKTALLRAFAATLPTAQILSASGDAAEQTVGFGVVEQLVRPVAPDLAAELRRAAPEIPVAGLRLADLLDEGQRVDPVVLLVDDAQWIDTPSMLALVFVLRRLTGLRVLTVIAARQEEATGIARIRHLVDDMDGRRLRLGGLRGSELSDLGERLGAGRLTAGAAERLREHTDGLPLHAKAMLEQVTSEALRALDRSLPVPTSYAMLVLGRLSACAPATRKLVVAASVLGDRCALDALSRLLDGDLALDALDEACAAGLLEVIAAPAGTLVAFEHRLTRLAVYEDLPPGRRATLHDRAAEQCPDEEGALDHRIAATLGCDRQLAADLATAATRAARRGDPLGAAERLLAAARIHEEPAERERCRVDAIELLVLGGDSSRAATLADEIAADAQDDPRGRYALALVEFARGRFATAEALLRAAFESAEPNLRERVAETLCHVCYLQLRADEAVEWGRRAHAEGSYTAALLVTSLALAGQADDPDAPVSVSEVPGPERLHGLLARGAQRLWTDDLHRARDDLREAARGLRGRGMFRTGLQALGYQALCEYRLGDWDRAIEHAQSAVSLAIDADQTWTLSRLHAFAILPLAARGEINAAEEHLRAAQEAAQRTELPLDRAGATIAAANVAVARGDHAMVVEELGSLVDSGAHRRTGEPGVSIWPCLYAEALVVCDRSDEAEAVLDPYERVADERGRRSAIAEAARVRGVVEAAAGREERATDAFARAVGHADLPYNRATVELSYGAFLRRRGRRREAAELLGRAYETLGHLGARPALERCERELAACGLRPSGRNGLDRDRLTPRELTVAGLAAGGATNREIAAELVVSINTVEYHLRNVFSKLGVRARRELAEHI